MWKERLNLPSSPNFFKFLENGIFCHLSVFLTKITEEYFHKYLWSGDLLMINWSNVQQNLQNCFYWWRHNFANMWPINSKIFWKHFLYTKGQLHIETTLKIKISLKKCICLQKHTSLQRFSVIQKMSLNWCHYLATPWPIKSNEI